MIALELSDDRTPAMGRHGPSADEDERRAFARDFEIKRTVFVENHFSDCHFSDDVCKEPTVWQRFLTLTRRASNIRFSFEEEG